MSRRSREELVDAVISAHSIIERLVGSAFGPLGSATIALHQRDLLGGGLQMTHSEEQELLKRAPRDAVKIKRKVSGYQKEFGRQMKKLIRAHPRTPRTKLMSKAHRLTKKARK